MWSSASTSVQSTAATTSGVVPTTCRTKGRMSSSSLSPRRAAADRATGSRSCPESCATPPCCDPPRRSTPGSRSRRPPRRSRKSTPARGAGPRRTHPRATRSCAPFRSAFSATHTGGGHHVATIGKHEARSMRRQHGPSQTGSPRRIDDARPLAARPFRRSPGTGRRPQLEGPSASSWEPHSAFNALENTRTSTPSARPARHGCARRAVLTASRRRGRGAQLGAIRILRVKRR